jgi:asparagine synthase (glutamine-hydrolysing)
VLKYPIKKVVDELSVAIACTIGYLPGDQTLLTSVKKVRPSEYVTFDLSTRLLTKNFFSQNDTNYFPSNIEESFQQLVREHLVSKERVSINLSGGLDSSVLVYEMKKLGYDIHSYSTHFDIDDEQINKDALLANKLAREYSTDHTEIDIDKKKFWDNFIEAHRTIEEPNYNVSLPVYLITAKMEGINGDQNRVVLSGDGGDEIFGGYSHYKESLRFSKIENMLTPYVFSFIKNVRSGTDFKFYKSDERWLFFKIFQHSWVKEEHLDAIKKYVSDSTEEWVELYGSKRGPVYDMMLRDRILWLAGENFIRTDKIFMSQSIEMRAPLSYAPFRAHMDSLIPDDQYIGPVNKIYLRKIYEHKLPEYIVNRQDKTGWRAPISQWYDKSAKNLFLEILSSKHLTGRLIDWEQLRQYIVERDGWPGKHVHIYLSLAILAREYNIDL